MKVRFSKAKSLVLCAFLLRGAFANNCNCYCESKTALTSKVNLCEECDSTHCAAEHPQCKDSDYNFQSCTGRPPLGKEKERGCTCLCDKQGDSSGVKPSIELHANTTACANNPSICTNTACAKWYPGTCVGPPQTNVTIPSANRAICYGDVAPPCQIVFDGANNTVCIDMDILAGIMILMAPLLVLWGEKLFKYLIFLVGSIVTFFGSTLLLDWISDTWMQDAPMDETMKLVIASCIAVVGGGICVFVYKLAIFVAGATFGCIAAQFVFNFIVQNTGYDEIWLHITLLVVLGIAMGALACYIMEKFLMVVTPFVGGFGLVSGLDYYAVRFGWITLTWFDPKTFFTRVQQEWKQCNWVCYMFMATWAACWILGTSYQCFKHKKDKKRVNNKDLQVQLIHHHHDPHPGRYGV